MKPTLQPQFLVRLAQHHLLQSPLSLVQGVVITCLTLAHKRLLVPMQNTITKAREHEVDDTKDNEAAAAAAQTRAEDDLMQ